MKSLFIGIKFQEERNDAAVVSTEGDKEAMPKATHQFATTATGYRQLIE